MPARLESGDRKFLMVSGALLIALTVAALVLEPPRAEPSKGFPSSYSSGADGSKAAYLLLGDLGYRVERWSRPPTELAAPTNTVLVLAEPVFPSSSDERFALRRFVSAGGRLLLTGPQAASLLGGVGPKTLDGPFAPPQTFTAEAPSPVTLGAPTVAMKTRVRWATQEPGQLRLYGDKDGATVVSIPLGRGLIIWWADPGPLTNSGLIQASNLRLFLNSVEPQPAAAGSVSGPHAVRVLWDEYFHGERLGLWSYLGKTPLPWFMLQLALVFLGIIVTFGRRSGPVRSLMPQSRLSPLEFVQALGGLYQRKGAAAGAVEIAYRRFQDQLSRRLGAPASASSEALYRGIHDRLGWTVPGLWETLQACERAVNDARLGNSRSLQLIQELYDHSHRLGLEEFCSPSSRPRQ